MKKLLSVLLVSVLLLTQFALPSFAFEDGTDDYWEEEEWVDPYEGLAVESVTVEAERGMIENIDGWEEDIYDENYETILGSYFCYDLFTAELYVTVVYENGEVEEGYAYDLYGFFEYYDNQSEEPWGKGKHTVTGYYRDFEFTFEVEVVETPVASVTAVAQNPLVEGWDSYTDIRFDEENEEAPPVYYTWYPVYDTKPVFTITMKDGTVYKGTDEEIALQTGYWTDEITDQFENPLKVGKNTVKFTYLNVECECEIEISPNPYKNVSLKGENEVYLTFEGIDAKDSFETKIVYCDIYYYDEEVGGFYGVIATEDGKEYEIVVYCGFDEDGNLAMDKDVSIAIGPFTTNTLEKCNFFRMAYNSVRVIDGALDYYQFGEAISGKQFDGYNAEEADIDDLVALAILIAAEYEDFEYIDDNTKYKVSERRTEELIEKVFGIADADAKKSALYKPFKGIEFTVPWNTEWYYEESELVFEDGKWTDTALISNWETGEIIGKITVVRNEDGFVDSISMIDLEVEKGDVNLDGEVTAVDARMVLQYVAGLIDELDINWYYSDVNGDDDVTAVDARLILQKVAGIIE